MAGEKNLQTKILNDLRSYGKHIVVTKIQKCSDNAVPDIFFTTLITGAVFIEVKDKGKVPKKNQEIFIQKLNNCGCKALSCNSWNDWVYIKKLVGLTKSSLFSRSL